MKKIIEFIIVVITAVLYTACQQQELTLPGNRIGDVTKQFALNILPMAGDPIVRAPEGIDESQVKNIWVLEFDKDGKCLLNKYIDNVDISSNNKITIDELVAADDATLWFVANTFDNTLFADANRPPTLAAFKERRLGLTANDVESSLFVTNGNTKYLRASGSWMGKISSDGGVNDFISIALAHLAAKITVSYEVPNNIKVNRIQINGVPTDMPYATTTDSKTEHGDIIPITSYATIENPQGNTFTFYVTENIAGKSNSQSAKEKTGKAPENSMFVQFDCTHTAQDDVETTLIATLYPGENTVDDYNVRINHNYNLHLKLTDNFTLDVCADDSRVSASVDMVTDGLLTWYEFDPDDMKCNSRWYNGAFIPNPSSEGHTGGDVVLRNLSPNQGKTADCKRVVYNTRIPNGTYSYTQGNDYLYHHGCGFDLNSHPLISTTEKPFTILYIGRSIPDDKEWGNVLYGPQNYHPTTKAGQRWYVFIRDSDNKLMYGTGKKEQQTVASESVYTDNAPITIVDTNTPEGEKFKRSIMVDGVWGQGVTDAHFNFGSTFYLGWNYNNAANFATKDGKLHLFLIYNRVLTAQEIGQIRAYVQIKGYTKK